LGTSNLNKGFDRVLMDSEQAKRDEMVKMKVLQSKSVIGGSGAMWNMGQNETS
jgi:hypothetical protein